MFSKSWSIYVFWNAAGVGLFEQMLTASVDRYESILAEVPVEYKQNLVQVTKYQDGQYCPVNFLLF
jgi:hypothetical protein